ncbi:MAG: hypothetical protein HKP52_05385 [Desulfofustis sp.]|nr:hypothetical protein [Desulfofustis sp.]NNK13653.1 hypothetical protein [Desulfofustis sp.]
MELILPPKLADELRVLYEDMDKAYDGVARRLGHTCDGCPDNCCDSYFLHHTYIEWAFLWQGLSALPEDHRRVLVSRANAYELEAQKLIARGKRPKLMCPLNEDGRCSLYTHRLMVCRTHGVPASMTRPDGKQLKFPGCFRCQELVVDQGFAEHELPLMERTELLQRLVSLEQEFLLGKRHIAPKVKRTISAMLIDGVPELPHCSDRTSTC